jgi:outer membrane protein TolC
MHWPVSLLSVVLVALLPVTSAAQEPVTIDRAVQEALGHNASLRAARAGSAEASARVDEAQAGWFPRLSASESWQRSDEPVFVFSSLLSARQFTASNFALDALNRPGALSFFQATVGLEQVLFDGGRQRSAARIAILGRDVSNFGVDESAAALAVTVTETFGRVVSADARAHAAAAAVDAVREDLARAERRRDAGMVSDADVLALAAQSADMQQRVIQAQGDAAVARAELNRLMGASVDAEYDIVEPTSATIAGDTNAPLDALFAEADRARPELQRVAAAERLADEERAHARSALVPVVAAQAAVDFSGTSVADRASAWAIGGSLRWNLSLGGAELARMRAAADARTRARAEAEDLRAAVHVDIVTAVSRVKTATARQAVARAAVDQARQSQRIIRDRFDAGLAGVTEVLRASSAVLDAEAQRVASIVDAMIGDAMLRRALGRRP